MVSHIVGAVFGVIALILCTVFGILHNNPLSLAGGVIYGVMMIFLFTMSSVYHGLPVSRAKKVLQVIDHCSIFAMILGTYAPVLFAGIRPYSNGLFLGLTAALLAVTAVGVTFTAIDVNRFKPVSLVCYIAIGWSVVLVIKPLLATLGKAFFLWLLIGGLFFTFGVIFYVIGPKRKYFHSIFHLFILVGAILQFVGIFRFCI